jgi:UDP-N-acetyl-D-mannosaminuronate dehydrogenase
MVHDPCVTRWDERPRVTLVPDLAAALEEADAVVFTVPHRAYLDLTAEFVLAHAGRCRAVVDAQNLLTDATAEALVGAGLRVAGVGKGHWRAHGHHEVRP